MLINTINIKNIFEKFNFSIFICTIYKLNFMNFYGNVF
jgi:hypothetical protein